LEIRIHPDPVLRQVALPVEVFDEALTALARGMAAAMHESRGLGLAGPQVAVLKRIVVVSLDGEPGREAVLVNPEYVRTEGWEEGEEGCLSFPGIYVKIGRFADVVVRHRDLAGQVRQFQAQGLLARALQHEIDHLDGRLLVDRMSPVQRMAQRRNLRELERRYNERLTRVEADAADVG
jgi:peptide deformylase